MPVFSPRDIIKKAFHITRSHLWLWVFGLVAGGLDFNFRESHLKKEQIQNFAAWAGAHRGLALAGGFGAAVVFVFLLYAFGVAKSGLIWAISKLANPDKPQPKSVNFRTTFQAGRKHWKRVAGLHLLVWAAFLGLLVAYTLPVWYLFSLGADNRAMVLVILGFILFVPAAVVFAFANLYGSLFLVLYNTKVSEAMEFAFGLLQFRLRDTLLFGLLLMVLEILFVLALSFGILILGLLLSSLGAVSRTFSLVSPVVVIAVMVFFLAWFSVFQHAAWVLVFQRFVKDKRMSEAETSAIAAEAEPTVD